MKLKKYMKKALKTGDNVTMKLHEYVEGAKRTAIYNCKLLYPTLGLCGEIGELAGELFDMGMHHPHDSLLEIGDVLWYTANVAADADLTFEDICPGCERVRDIKPWEFQPNFTYEMPLLVHRMGVVAENVKKTIRDHQGLLTKSRKEKIRVALGDILRLLAYIAIDRGGTLEYCAKVNLEKLRSRAERGKLGGDGNDR